MVWVNSTFKVTVISLWLLLEPTFLVLNVDIEQKNDGISNLELEYSPHPNSNEITFGTEKNCFICRCSANETISFSLLFFPDCKKKKKFRHKL